MAYIKDTAFESRVTNNAFNRLANVTGLFKNAAGEDEICAAGFLCIRGAKLDNEGYVGRKNGNSREMKAAPVNTKVNIPIYACNTYDTQELTDELGNIYTVGSNILGLAVPAGVKATYTKIEFEGDKVYRFGAGLLTAAPAADDPYFVIADGRLTPANATELAALANGVVYFDIDDTGKFDRGTRGAFDYYDLIPRYIVKGA
ncbi:MAG: hypothetical protein RR235_05015 [Oscillospiraceae bacterium]